VSVQQAFAVVVAVVAVVVFVVNCCKIICNYQQYGQRLNS
jgi:hypothetical protein